ncbi:MAG: hypothetical protein KDI44_17200, partial [Thiothrix sp.]|nr:hypothetical protein [Thiothrix sp.]
MKKTLIATILLLVTATVAMANPGFGGRGLEAMKSALGLSDEQATQVEAIMQDERARMDAILDILPRLKA